MIRIDGVADVVSIEGEWLGRKLQFFRSSVDKSWLALAGADVETPPGPSTLHVIVHTKGEPVDLSRAIEIHPAHYRTGTLSVAPKFVEPGPEEQKQIAADSEIKTKVFAVERC